jgi:hypothetical protein
MGLSLELSVKQTVNGMYFCQAAWRSLNNGKICGKSLIGCAVCISYPSALVYQRTFSKERQKEGVCTNLSLSCSRLFLLNSREHSEYKTLFKYFQLSLCITVFFQCQLFPRNQGEEQQVPGSCIFGILAKETQVMK